MGITYSVVGPSVVNATISLTITAAPGYQKTALQGPVASAIESYVNGLDVGAALGVLPHPGARLWHRGRRDGRERAAQQRHGRPRRWCGQVVRTISVAVN